MAPAPARALLVTLLAAASSTVTVVALTPAAPRQAIDFPEDLVLLRSAGEPEFQRAAVQTCTVNRQHGFSLLTPGFADGMASVNFVRTRASYINGSACVCHLAEATNATGGPIPGFITAGESTVVLDAGGSPCDMALKKLCPGDFQRGPACWTCARGVHAAALKAAGCDKAAYKGYCGPQNEEELSAVLMDAHREVERRGLQGGKICMSGNYVRLASHAHCHCRRPSTPLARCTPPPACYSRARVCVCLRACVCLAAAVVWQTCATIEHFAAFAPAFGRRPYILESNLSLVVKTDYSLAGVALRLSTVIAGVPLAGEIVPNSAGHAKLEFSLSLLPRANFSETVNITLTLPDGRSKSKPRRFMRCAAGKKRLFWSHFYILQTIILPRQARDKHRASTQKKRVVFFLQGLAPCRRHADEHCAGRSRVRRSADGRRAQDMQRLV